MAKIKKAQTGKDVPKGYVKGEMTGKLYKKKDFEAHQKKVTEAMNDEYFNRPENAKYGKASAPKPPAKSKKTVIKSPAKKMKSGGSFGMLSVKAGVDKNPKPTAADRIAGAKMNAGKMKKGGTMKKCKYGCN